MGPAAGTHLLCCCGFRLISPCFACFCGHLLLGCSRWFAAPRARPAVTGASQVLRSFLVQCLLKFACRCALGTPAFFATLLSMLKMAKHLALAEAQVSAAKQQQLHPAMVDELIRHPACKQQPGQHHPAATSAQHSRNPGQMTGTATPAAAALQAMAMVAPPALLQLRLVRRAAGQCLAARQAGMDHHDPLMEMLQALLVHSVIANEDWQWLYLSSNVPAQVGVMQETVWYFGCHERCFICCPQRETGCLFICTPACKGTLTCKHLLPASSRTWLHSAPATAQERPLGPGHPCGCLHLCCCCCCCCCCWYRTLVQSCMFGRRSGRC